ncbi:immunoglobulin-like domain-containing protein [Listeria costaricensis]|uniref:immunoglobulin-like domain-containing protein n=1 Tax=Listeria costaricensis TaxID=2026604 RepID=UPI000C077150|nr:immunoglobulin-like domain-containing protein [Listeria costaricensis]
MGAPVISTVTTKDTSVTVTGEAGAQIKLTLPDGSVMEKTADANGQAVFTIPAQTAGKEISATQTGANGKASPAATVKVQQVSEGTLTVNAPFYVGYDTSVKATATGDIQKVYLLVDGVKYQTVSASGNFSYYAKDKITSLSQNVQLVGLDANSHEVARATVPLKDGSIMKGTVAPDKYYIGVDSYVKGTYTGAVQKVALSVNGQVSQKVSVLDKTNFQYYAKDKITSKTDKVELIGYNSEGTKITSTTVNLGDASELVGSVTTNEFAISEDAYVTGTYQDNVHYVSLTVNGQEYKKVQVLDDKNFQYYAKGLITKTTDSVQINAYNSAGVKVDTKNVQLIDSREKEGILAPMAYTLEDNYVNGTYTGDIKYVALKVNGTTYGKVNVLDSNNFRYYAKDKIKNTTDSVQVIGYNAAGGVIDTKPVTVNAKPVAKGVIETADTYELGTNYTSGTYSGDIQKVALKVGDTTYSTVPVSSDGTWKYYAKDKIKDTTTPVTIIGYNQAGEAVSEKTITVKEATPAQVTFSVDPYTVSGGSGWIQGTYSGDITKVQLEVDGQAKSEVPVNSDGTWKYYAKDKISSTSQTAKMLAYSSQNKVVAEQTIILQ